MDCKVRSALVLGLLAGLILVHLSLPAQMLEQAPPNPAFLAYLDEVAAGRWVTVGPTGLGLGYIPSPVSYRSVAAPPPPWRREGAPTSYDLRNIANKVPSIRNQGACGSCWTFSTYASLETSIRPSDTLDCSENNLKNTHGFLLSCCAGGYAQMSMAYLARWSGPVSETDDPYNPSSCNSPEGLTVERHLQHAWLLPVRTSPTDNDTIKNAILDYGAVHTAMYAMGGSMGPPYWNSTTGAYYYNGNATYPDHAVAIIGWDDNYSRDNFDSTNKPANNGAWLIHNSWGHWGPLGGYFWASYEDKFIGNKENALFYGVESRTNYATIYDYDPLGWVTSLGYTGTLTLWLANRFTTGNIQQQLAAVSFYTNDSNADYRIYCYKNPSTSNPTSGTSMLPSPGYIEGTFSYPGFHTVTLPAVETLNLGTSDSSFSVVLRIINSSQEYPGCVECDGTYADASGEAERSFYSANGTSWYDLYTFDKNADFCIKAYTYPGVLMVTIMDFQAHPAAPGIVVTWRTANEVSTAGFRVLRSQHPSGPFEVISREIVPARGAGSSYEFVDRQARAGCTYFYRLQEVTEDALMRDCSPTIEATARPAPLYDLLPSGLRLLLGI
ncbi:MAG: lectin like domain-containing protein [Candidatus Zipacnadales bacterium]